MLKVMFNLNIFTFSLKPLHLQSQNLFFLQKIDIHFRISKAESRNNRIVAN